MPNLLSHGDFRAGSVDLKIGNGAGTVPTSTAAIGQWSLNCDETDAATNTYVRVRNILMASAVAASKVTEPPAQVIGDYVLLFDIEAGSLGASRVGYAEVEQTIISSPKALSDQSIELNLFVYSAVSGTFGVNVANINVYAGGTISNNIVNEAVQLQVGWNRIRRVFQHPHVLDTDPVNGAYVSGHHLVVLVPDQGAFSNVNINQNTTIGITGVYFGQANAEFDRVEEISRQRTIDLADGTTHAVPSGGTTGQVLEKNSNTDYDASWTTPANPSAVLPTGGTVGQVLKKNSSTNYDASFAGVLGTNSESTTTGAIAVDLTAGKEIDRVVLTGNPTFSTANRANGLFKSIRIDSNGSSRSISFTSGWVWLGTDNSAGVTLASGKSAVLSLTCYGSNETDIVACYVAQP